MIIQSFFLMYKLLMIQNFIIIQLIEKFKYQLSSIMKQQKPYIFNNFKHLNYGGRLLLAEQAAFHQKKIDRIRSASPKINISIKVCNRQKMKTIGKQTFKSYQQQIHNKNIQILSSKISKHKNMADRKKDKNDFFAFPVYFFRYLAKSTTLKKRKRNYQQNQHLSNVKKSNTENNDFLNSNEQSPRLSEILDKQTIKNNLPYLTSFERSDIQEFADFLTRLIFKYNINSTVKLQYLHKEVLQAIPKNYPTDFKLIIEQMFKQMAQSLGLA